MKKVFTLLIALVCVPVFAQSAGGGGGGLRPGKGPNGKAVCAEGETYYDPAADDAYSRFLVCVDGQFVHRAQTGGGLIDILFPDSEFDQSF